MGIGEIGSYSKRLKKHAVEIKVKKLVKLMFSHFGECFFLGLANKLPRNQVSDRIYSILLCRSGVKIGHRSRVWGPLDIRPIGAAHNISIGDKVFINSGVRFGCPPPAKIIIGNHVAIGPRVLFETLNHSLTHNNEGYRPGKSKDIVVEDYVWIGANATVLPDVKIGRGSVVAAGSVVTKDIPPYCLAAGIPAQIIRKLDEP